MTFRKDVTSHLPLRRTGLWVSPGSNWAPLLACCSTPPLVNASSGVLASGLGRLLRAVEGLGEAFVVLFGADGQPAGFWSLIYGLVFDGYIKICL